LKVENPAGETLYKTYELEAFSYRIDVTISLSAHAGDQTVAIKHGAPIITGVPTTLIQMHDHFTGGFTSSTRHHQRIYKTIRKNGQASL
jgi:hypothetical protein